MVEPTLTKNTARSNPLKGSICASNSCLNSLFANITPAKKAPKAGERPIETINSETPITKNREEAVNNSVIPAFETYRKKGTIRFKTDRTNEELLYCFFPISLVAEPFRIETCTSFPFCFTLECASKGKIAKIGNYCYI